MNCHRLVKNLSRRQEGRIPTANLQGILGDSIKNHSNRLGGESLFAHPLPV